MTVTAYVPDIAPNDSSSPPVGVNLPRTLLIPPPPIISSSIGSCKSRLFLLLTQRPASFSHEAVSGLYESCDDRTVSLYGRGLIYCESLSVLIDEEAFPPPL